jgi:hypothetical protein
MIQAKIIFLALIFLSVISTQSCDVNTPYRTSNGACNNLDDPLLGASGEPWYGITGLGFFNRLNDSLPKERTISNHLYAIENSKDPINRYNISLAEVFFGQFLNHDQELNVDEKSNIYRIIVEEQNDILKFNPMHPNIPYMNLSYSKPFNSTPFQFINGQTSFLDLSTVYGFTSNMTDKLRLHQDGLLMGKNYTVCVYNSNPPPFGNGTCTNETHVLYDLPVSEYTTNIKNDLGLNDFGQDKNFLFSCGDIRCNENIALSMYHTAFFREHNRNARMIKQKNGTLDDEILFQEARKLTIAIYQSIIFREYLPTIIGKDYMQSLVTNFSGYKNVENPATSHVFAGAAFRYGHSSLRAYQCLDQNGCTIDCVPSWTPAYYNFPQTIMPVLGSLGPEGFTIPDLIYNAGGYSNLAYSLVYQLAAEIDNYMDDSFRNLGAGFNPLDIPSADIARGRINGLPDYHTLRAFFFDSIYGKPNCPPNPKITNASDPIECFSYITSNLTAATKLKTMYDRIDRIDPITGMFFEDHELDSPLGPTMARAILREYERKRDNDRFWYENLNFEPEILEYINNRTMVHLMNDNFGISLTSFFHVMPKPAYICPIHSTSTPQSTTQTSSTVTGGTSNIPTTVISITDTPTSASTTSSASSTSGATSASSTPTSSTPTSASSSATTETSINVSNMIVSSLFLIFFVVIGA